MTLSRLVLGCFDVLFISLTKNHCCIRASGEITRIQLAMLRIVSVHGIEYIMIAGSRRGLHWLFLDMSSHPWIRII